MSRRRKQQGTPGKRGGIRLICQRSHDQVTLGRFSISTGLRVPQGLSRTTLSTATQVREAETLYTTEGGVVRIPCGGCGSPRLIHEDALMTAVKDLAHGVSWTTVDIDTLVTFP